MPQTLSNAQIETLKSYVSKGDRFNYWQKLSEYGDPYARLALGVVTNETLSGQVANGNMAAVAKETGIKISASDNWKIGIRIMQEDFTFRKSEMQLELNAKVIEDYHTKVFDEYKLPPTAWTAYEVLKQAKIRGGTSEYEKVWAALVSGEITSQALVTGQPLLLNKNPELNYYSRLLGIISNSAFESGQGQIGAYKSLRNANFIDGYTLDTSTGKWFFRSISPLGISLTEADQAKSAELNTERAARIKNFGANVLKISQVEDATDAYTVAEKITGLIGLRDIEVADASQVSVNGTNIENWGIARLSRIELQAVLANANLVGASIYSDGNSATVVLISGDRISIDRSGVVQRASGSLDGPNSKLTVTQGDRPVEYQRIDDRLVQTSFERDLVVATTVTSQNTKGISIVDFSYKPDGTWSVSDATVVDGRVLDAKESAKLTDALNASGLTPAMYQKGLDSGVSEILCVRRLFKLAIG